MGTVIRSLGIVLGCGCAASAQELPLITEVLYAVPRGEAGDASGDGSRDAIGDEFVEISNPSGTPFALTGWTVTDRNPPDAGQFMFRFPEFTLGPGETVVVFNGLDQEVPGACGTAEQAPTGPHAAFAGAWVFSAGNTSSRSGFANDGDWVCLRDHQGEVVSCIAWGELDVEPPVGAPLLEEAPRTSAASVQRTVCRSDGVFEPHPTVGGLRFSPGRPPPRGD